MIKLNKLTRDNIDELQSLLTKCEEYLKFQDDEPVSDQAAEQVFTELPEDAVLEQKSVFGIYLEYSQQLIGVIDLLEGYRDKETLTLGLMVIEPQSRQSGFGKASIAILEKWALSQNLKKIRLGVIIGNHIGDLFWKSLGFKETGEVKLSMAKKKFKVLEKRICG